MLFRSHLIQEIQNNVSRVSTAIRKIEVRVIFHIKTTKIFINVLKKDNISSLTTLLVYFNRKQPAN